MALAVLTFRARKNGVNGNSVVEVLQSQIGRFEDAVNTDAFVETNELNYLGSTMGMASGAINLMSVEMMITLPSTAAFAARVMML